MGLTEAAHCPFRCGTFRSIFIVNLFLMFSLTQPGLHLHPSLTCFKFFLLAPPLKSQGGFYPSPLCCGAEVWPSPWSHRLGALLSPRAWHLCSREEKDPAAPSPDTGLVEHGPCALGLSQ